MNWRRPDFRNSCLACLLILFFAGLARPAFSQNPSFNYGGSVQTADRTSINASQAGKIAQRKYGGKVVKITPVKNGGGTNYLVRILQDSGKVINVTVNGQTGKIQ